MRRLLFGFAAAAFLLGTAPLTSAQEDPRAVIDKAVKAYGGAEKLAKIKALQTKASGTIDLAGGIKFEQEAMIQLPDRMKDRMQMEVMGQQVAVTTVYDGTKGWLKVNDMVMDMDENLLELMKEATYMLRLTQQVFLLKDKSVELAPLGEVKVNDRPAVGIKVSKKGQKDLNLYFDKQTGLLAKTEHRTRDYSSGQELDEERIILEYQDVDGLKVAKKILVNRDGKKFTEADVNEIKFVDKIDDAEFTKP
jgi:hypothetical protein